MDKKFLFLLIVILAVGIIKAVVDLIKSKLLIDLLMGFRNNYVKWVNSIEHTDTFNITQGDPKLRSEVVALIPHVAKVLNDLGRGFGMRMPPPAIGGPIIPINLIEECVDLRLLADRRTIPQRTADKVDKAISEYRAKAKFAFLNIFNPVYWIKSTLSLILYFPFFLFETIGFGKERIKAFEMSIWGKLLKLGILALAVLADLHTFGFLKSIWGFIKELVKN